MPHPYTVTSFYGTTVTRTFDTPQKFVLELQKTARGTITDLRIALQGLRRDSERIPHYTKRIAELEQVEGDLPVGCSFFIEWDSGAGYGRLREDARELRRRGHLAKVHRLANR